MSDKPLVSVLLCTYNPEKYLLEWALRSLEKQTLPKTDFEVLLVDNNSRPPLDADPLCREFNLNLHVIREPRQGLTFARCAGIAAARADLLVFIDDDNALDPDYLENALKIAREEPPIGHFGGVAKALLDGPIRSWQEQLLPYLGVRDYGPEPITSFADCWGKWEPIGAGMVCRAEVARRFIEIVQTTRQAGALGRSGKSLMSGEDSLLARAAHRLGYACSYQPALRLTHFIRMPRLRFCRLARLLLGHGRSYVVLETVLGKPVSRYTLPGIAARLAMRLVFHCRQRGRNAGIIAWFWDVGFFFQSRRLRRTAASIATAEEK